VSTAQPPASVADAVAMVLDGMRYLAAADHAGMAAQAQAECLAALEQADAMSTAARAGILGSYTANRGYCADADYSPTAWLINRTKITKGAAREHVAWSRRAAAHPLVIAALAEGDVLSGSMAKLICQWSDRLPAGCRDAADDILVAAARAGADKQGLAALAAEIYTRSLPDSQDDDGGGLGLDFEDRRVRVETTFGGAGVIAGDLTPECAAVVTAVLEALSAPADADDTRTKDQRFHDGLCEAMRRLAAAGLLPQRAGQPVKVWAHVTLAELRALDDGSVLQDQWIGEMAIRWAANRAAASEGGSDGGAWLDGPAARATACDAVITPVVTGDVDPGVLDDLVRLCVQLDRLDHPVPADPVPAEPVPAEPAPADPEPDPAGPADFQDLVGVPAGLLSGEALRKAIIGKAADLLSGPGGLASFLRTRQLGARLAGPSLPLDIGYSTTIPRGIRNLVILRDQRCRWPGGCNQPAAACEVHHVKHKAHGGPTSLADCVLLCSYHHQVVIHRWGWTLVLNPDGTTTAWNPGRTKILHSHGPPARAG
jgi:Domain of unknown function (DUF222)/HNH endonuclease